MRSPPFLEPPATAREERARRAVEAVLAGGLVATLLACLLRGPEPPFPAVAGASRPTPQGAMPSALPSALSDAPFRSLDVDVANAPAWMLRLLPSVGASRAEAIVADRERNGAVPSLDALRRVHGFGRKSVETLGKAGATAVPRSTIPAKREGPAPPVPVPEPGPGPGLGASPAAPDERGPP